MEPLTRRVLDSLGRCFLLGSGIACFVSLAVLVAVEAGL